MVGTHEIGGRACIGPRNHGAAVATAVQENVQPTLGVSGDDDRILPHDPGYEIPRLAEFGLMGDEQPAPREDAFKFETVQVRIRNEPPADLSLISPDQGLEIGTVRPLTETV